MASLRQGLLFPMKTKGEYDNVWRQKKRVKKGLNFSKKDENGQAQTTSGNEFSL
jgi:hypothetical protein